MAAHARTLFGPVCAVGIAAWVAHLLAWAAGLGLVFAPAYRGVTTTPVQVDPATGQVIGPNTLEMSSQTATLIEVNGLHAGLLLLVPIALTGLAVLAVRFTGVVWFLRKLLQGALAALFLVGCFLAMFSIGVFYIPSALALLVAACLPLPRGAGPRRAVG